MSWNPDLYLRFEKERTQPAIDLVSRITIQEPRLIIDIGCGPGNSTSVLRDKFPGCAIEGIDNSAEMIEKAKSAHPWGTWIHADACEFDYTRKYDIIFSNAAFHWIPNRDKLIHRLIDCLSPAGMLAVQIPNNHTSPLNKSLSQLAEDPAWSLYFSSSTEETSYRTPEFYYNLLSGLKVDLWTSTYYHLLDSIDDIIAWYSSTGLRPYLDALPNNEARALFTAALKDLIRDKYPEEQDGKVFFPFKRLFFTAHS
jgi:trans-aconitate 2-methyltransferase